MNEYFDSGMASATPGSCSRTLRDGTSMLPAIVFGAWFCAKTRQIRAAGKSRRIDSPHRDQAPDADLTAPPDP
jgi:hypothetical protein